MEKTKHSIQRELQTYIPASVKVIELTTQRGICILAGSVTNPFGGDEEEW